MPAVSAPTPPLTIGALPFHERPARPLLALDEDRDQPLRDYAGYGWAVLPEVWLSSADGAAFPVADALVLALHAADDGEPMADDVELEFELAAPGTATADAPGAAGAAPGAVGADAPGSDGVDVPGSAGAGAVDVPGSAGAAAKAPPSVLVLASDFLARWLPRLPRASAIVLAMCNPHRARLRRPAGADGPLHVALGDVFSWLDLDPRGDRIRLAADTWTELPR